MAYLGHHNLNPTLAWSVNQVRTTFVHEHEGSRKGSGTGFWLRTHDNHLAFVTNRHNFDAAVQFGRSGFTLDQVELHLRIDMPGLLLYDAGDFFTCTNVASALFMHETADVAVLVDPLVQLKSDPRYQPKPIFPDDVLADIRWLRSELHMMDECFFIGYPGTPARLSRTTKDVHFWDTKKRFPIARQAVIASPPESFFENEHIKTAATILVSGMSFAGSSGSPVVTPELGVPPNQLGLTGAYRAARLIGIMSGHFDTQEAGTTFAHAGLSYLTASHVIIKLIERARRLGWRADSSRAAQEP